MEDPPDRCTASNSTSRAKDDDLSDSLESQLRQTLAGTHTVEREMLGGGLSRLFLGSELRFRRQVVIKVLPPEFIAGVSAERFEREIAFAANLQHANIVPVLTAGETAGLPFYTMPFVDGESLDSLLKAAAVDAEGGELEVLQARIHAQLGDLEGGVALADAGRNKGWELLSLMNSLGDDHWLVPLRPLRSFQAIVALKD